MSFDVIGLGCGCLDFLAIVPNIPELDDEVRSFQSTQQGGGEVATALVALAKLGTSTSYLGRIGEDSAGYFIKREFERYDVDTSHMIMEPNATSLVSAVLVDQASGKRSIVAGSTTASEFRPADIPDGLIECAKYLHLDATSRKAALVAAERAKSSDVTVVLDADVLAYDDEIGQLVQLTDVMIASEGFSRRWTGTVNPDEAIEIMRSQGPETVVLTLGDQGSICVNKGQVIYTDAFPVEVIDTTGAGDVYHGAFIFGMLQEWPLEKTAEFASAVAAMKCTKLGGRQGIPTYDEAISFVKNRNANYF
ncbi:MAG: PfkB family carbohydrate kinase [Gemmatimonadota bacterium]|nr:PfkB family carbohydrate kinase [Gemmatimonadota bacterium]